MNGFALLVMMAVLIQSALAQTSFEEHYALASKGTLGKREDFFAKMCGVSRADSKIVYGESLDDKLAFQATQGIGNVASDSETDSFGIAEMWSVGGKPRLLNVWVLTLDTGYFSNEMFCIKDLRIVTMQETLNGYQPVTASTGGWLYLQRRYFTHLSKERFALRTFVNKSGHPVPSPKLSADDLAEVSASANPQFAADVIRRLMQGRGK